jgi:hypothetical protein
VYDSNIVAYDCAFKENHEKFQDNILKPRFEFGSFQIKKEYCTLRCMAVVNIGLTLFWSFCHSVLVVTKDFQLAFQACVLVPKCEHLSAQTK